MVWSRFVREIANIDWLEGHTEAESLHAGRTNTAINVSPSDSLETAVSEAEATGKKIQLEPGVHDSHNYPVDIPDGVAISGPAMGYHTGPEASWKDFAVLDASGGVALRATGEYAKGVKITDLLVKGTIQIDAVNENRDFAVERVFFKSPTTTAGTGRGLEVLGPSWLYTVRDIFARGADSYGVYIEHDGQAVFDNIRCFDCGHTPNAGDPYAGNIYISSRAGGGGEAEYRSLIAGSPSFSGVDGVVADGLFAADIFSPQLEACRKGFRFAEANADNRHNTIIGGRVLNGADGIYAGGDTGTANLSVGTSIRGVSFGGNSGTDIVMESDTRRFFLGENYGAGSNFQSIGMFSVTNNGTGNHTDLINNFAPNDTGEDLTARSPVYSNEIALHDGTDGTNVNARGPAIANGTDPATADWVSLIDGSTIA